MYITILGRQPALGMAELERLSGAANTRWFSDESAVVSNEDFAFDRLGGSLKAGHVTMELSGNWGDVSKKITAHYSEVWANLPHKITLGISAYGFKVTARDVQKTGIIVKQRLKTAGGSIRLVPNDYPALNTATSHHNRLGLSPNKVELLVVRSGSGKVIVAESVGAQNITSIAARDQARPYTDAFIGMLPPKLARIMVNCATAHATPSPNFTILDPFCGTGVVLQESLLLGYSALGSDLNPKMVTYTSDNLQWLKDKHANLEQLKYSATLGDATKTSWGEAESINAVVSETYLGQPFSAPPRPEKLKQVMGNCNHIITAFLQNLHGQLAPGTPLCLAVPAWRDKTGQFSHLPLVRDLTSLGYQPITCKNVQAADLLYYRETQVVARELLLLTCT